MLLQESRQSIDVLPQLLEFCGVVCMPWGDVLDQLLHSQLFISTIFPIDQSVVELLLHFVIACQGCGSGGKDDASYVERVLYLQEIKAQISVPGGRPTLVSELLLSNLCNTSHETWLKQGVHEQNHFLDHN